MTMRHWHTGGLVAALLLGGPVGAQTSRPVSGELSSVTLGVDRLMPSADRTPSPIVRSEGVAQTGDVELEVVVGQQGRVLHARVTRASDPSGLLAPAAMEAVRDWAFKPALDLRGDPVTTLVRVRLEFPAARPDGTVPPARGELTPLPAEPQPASDFPPDLTACPGGRDRGSPPVPLRIIKPTYTNAAMSAKVQGSVELQIEIRSDGTVGRAAVKKPLHPDLDRQALTAARYWFFEPAHRDGEPIACRATLLLDFRLR